MVGPVNSLQIAKAMQNTRNKLCGFFEGVALLCIPPYCMVILSALSEGVRGPPLWGIRGQGLRGGGAKPLRRIPPMSLVRFRQTAERGGTARGGANGMGGAGRVSSYGWRRKKSGVQNGDTGEKKRSVAFLFSAKKRRI